jgi:hypothetical protein
LAIELTTTYCSAGLIVLHLMVRLADKTNKLLTRFAKNDAGNYSDFIFSLIYGFYGI